MGHLIEPTFGVRRRTLRDIMAILKDNYGTLTAHELEQQKRLLLEPYSPSSPIREYTRRHKVVHTACESAGQAMSAAEKVQHLRAGVRHVPQFAAAVQHYLMTTPSVAQQTFTALADILAQAEDNGDPSPTAGSAGYSAATVGAPREATFTLSEVTAMISAAVAKALQDSSTTAPKRQSTQYCWTHGPSAHSSRDCRAPAQGHITEATNTDRRGGASVNPRHSKKK